MALAIRRDPNPPSPGNHAHFDTQAADPSTVFANGLRTEADIQLVYASASAGDHWSYNATEDAAEGHFPANFGLSFTTAFQLWCDYPFISWQNDGESYSVQFQYKYGPGWETANFAPSFNQTQKCFRVDNTALSSGNAIYEWQHHSLQTARDYAVQMRLRAYGALANTTESDIESTDIRKNYTSGPFNGIRNRQPSNRTAFHQADEGTANLIPLHNQMIGGDVRKPFVGLVDTWMTCTLEAYHDGLSKVRMWAAEELNQVDVQYIGSEDFPGDGMVWDYTLNGRPATDHRSNRFRVEFNSSGPGNDNIPLSVFVRNVVVQQNNGRVPAQTIW